MTDPVDTVDTPAASGEAAPAETGLTPDPAAGVNVQAVRDAIEAMRQGTGSYEELKTAVQGAKFVPRPVARSYDDIAAAWDYVPVDDSFTDTVSRAQWQRVLTRDQVKELKGMAQFVGPAPSRQPSQGD
jgi:hypothetical protein